MILLDTDHVNVEPRLTDSGEEVLVTNVYAHRGASAELPENTLPAFARAMELGAFGVELDVHLTRDGIPVVIHDDTVDRTTDGVGAVADLDAVEVIRLDAGDGARVPLLDDVLDLFGDRLHLDIEVKAAAAADAVLKAISRRPALQFAVSSFDHDVLRHLRSRSRGVDLWPLTHAASDGVLETAAELGAPCIAMKDDFVNREIVDYLRSWSLGAWVWTVNDASRAAELKAMGVVGICTDDPDILLRAGRN